MGSATKISEEVKMTDLVRPDVTVSGNYCMLKFTFFNLF